MTLLKHTTPASPVAEHFLNCLRHSDHQREPYDHWLLSDALPQDVTDAIAALPVDPADIPGYSGYRNTEDDKRVYFNKWTNARYPVCAQVADALDHPDTRHALEERCGIDLSDGQLRIEYCQDTTGFWLAPHTDISVKKFTMLIYLSPDPALYDAGTDIYSGPPDHKLVATVPYEQNRGLIFIPGSDTWHGFTKRPINGVRKSLIVNYVTPDWRDTWELA